MEPTLKFIGTIHSPLKRIEDCPLQENENAPEAMVEIAADFKDGITDIHTGAEIVIVTWLHKADRSVIRCVSRNNYDGPKIGVFSTRSPDRPNPIGLHVAKVIGKTGEGWLKVSGLEVLDGTPVVDIKPIWSRSF